MNHCVLVTVLELASGKPIFFPWDISKYVPALSKVPLFLFPGTVTLGSNNHSGLETAIESKICTFYFLLSNIAKMSKSRCQDNLIQFFLNLGPQADCNFLEVSAR